MLRLDTPTRKLEALLDNTGTEVIFTVSFKKKTNKEIQSELGRTTITPSNGTNVVQICEAPNQSEVIEIDLINVYNGNAATRVFTIQIDDNATDRILAAISLATTESACWTPDSGEWKVST